MPLEKKPPTQQQTEDTPKIAVMRMVVKEGISRDMVSILIQNYIEAIVGLEEQVRGLKDSSKTYKAVVTSDAESAQSSHDLVVKACLKVTYAQQKKKRCRSIAEGAK